MLWVGSREGQTAGKEPEELRKRGSEEKEGERGREAVQEKL